MRDYTVHACVITMLSRSAHAVTGCFQPEQYDACKSHEQLDKLLKPILQTWLLGIEACTTCFGLLDQPLGQQLLLLHQMLQALPHWTSWTHTAVHF